MWRSAPFVSTWPAWQDWHRYQRLRWIWQSKLSTAGRVRRSFKSATNFWCAQSRLLFLVGFHLGDLIPCSSARMWYSYQCSTPSNREWTATQSSTWKNDLFLDVSSMMFVQTCHEVLRVRCDLPGELKRYHLQKHLETCHEDVIICWQIRLEPHDGTEIQVVSLKSQWWGPYEPYNNWVHPTLHASATHLSHTRKPTHTKAINELDEQGTCQSDAHPPTTLHIFASAASYLATESQTMQWCCRFASNCIRIEFL